MGSSIRIYKYEKGSEEIDIYKLNWFIIYSLYTIFYKVKIILYVSFTIRWTFSSRF